MKAKITILGDVCPTSDTEKYFQNGDEQALFGNALELIQESDVSLCNLEFPLIDNGQSISKTGPILKGETSYINVFKNAGFTLLSMANNHIKDCGESGVLSTLATCQKNGIAHVGAGTNLQEAKRLHVEEVNGITIGVLAYAEQEFNIATDTEAGSNYFDLITDFDEVKKAKETVDYLIVLFHGGIEYYENPSPMLQKKCRRMVEMGADLVTCQHSHCIGTMEKINNGTILYGQGNSVFGYRPQDASWNSGLIIKIELNKSENGVNTELEFIPIEATPNGGIRIQPSSQNTLDAFHNRSAMIHDEDFIKRSWISFCESKKSLYLPQTLGFNRWLIHLNRLTKNKLVSLFFSKKKLQVVQNIIRCESHNEVIQTILNTANKK